MAPFTSAPSRSAPSASHAEPPDQANARDQEERPRKCLISRVWNVRGPGVSARRSDAGPRDGEDSRMCTALPSPCRRRGSCEWSRGATAWRLKSGQLAWVRGSSAPDLRQLVEVGRAWPAGKVLGVRVTDLGEKGALLAAKPDALFMILHFDGFPGLLGAPRRRPARLPSGDHHRRLAGAGGRQAVGDISRRLLSRFFASKRYSFRCGTNIWPQRPPCWLVAWRRRIRRPGADNWLDSGNAGDQSARPDRRFRARWVSAGSSR